MWIVPTESVCTKWNKSEVRRWWRTNKATRHSMSDTYWSTYKCTFGIAIAIRHRTAFMHRVMVADVTVLWHIDEPQTQTHTHTLLALASHVNFLLPFFLLCCWMLFKSSDYFRSALSCFLLSIGRSFAVFYFSLNFSHPNIVSRPVSFFI